MKAIWALAGAIVLALIVVRVGSAFFTPGALLTAGAVTSIGAAAAYLPGAGYVWRGVWLFVGVLFGAAGFLIGSLFFPDTPNGLMLGGIVPVLLTAIAAMWTRNISYFVAGLLGTATIGGVYANVFNTDPQGINVSLPIAIGWAMPALGIGYLAGLMVMLLLPEQPKAESQPAVEAEPPPAGDGEVSASEPDRAEAMASTRPVSASEPTVTR